MRIQFELPKVSIVFLFLLLVVGGIFYSSGLTSKQIFWHS